MLERFEVGIWSATRQRFAETCCEKRLHEATLSDKSRSVPLGIYSRRVRVAFLINFSGAKERHLFLNALGSGQLEATTESGLNAAKASTTLRNRVIGKDRRGVEREGEGGDLLSELSRLSLRGRTVCTW